LNTVIKNFKEWSLLEAAAAATGPVFFLSAATSASNVGPDLAANLGVKPDTLYTITFPGKDILTALQTFASREGTKFGKTMVIDAGTPTAKGQDVLEIGGTRIEEAGSAVFTKSQTPSITTIKASNNGLLVLARLAGGLDFLQKTRAITPASAADWAISLNLGGQVNVDESRGYTAWYAKLPSDSNEIGLTDIGNTIARVVSQAILKGSKLPTGQSAEAFINQQDPKNKEIFDLYIKDSADPIGSVSAMAVKAMMNREILPNSEFNSQAANALLQKFINGATTNLIFPKRDDQLVMLTPAGETAFAQICETAVNSILPTSAPAGFKAVPSELISSYSGLVKQMFGTRFKTKDNFNWVQKIHQYAAAKPGVGSTGSVKKQQAEGEI
jgi:hypothetical protein